MEQAEEVQVAGIVDKLIGMGMSFAAVWKAWNAEKGILAILGMQIARQVTRKAFAAVMPASTAEIAKCMVVQEYEKWLQRVARRVRLAAFAKSCSGDGMMWVGLFGANATVGDARLRMASEWGCPCWPYFRLRLQGVECGAVEDDILLKTFGDTQVHGHVFAAQEVICHKACFTLATLPNIFKHFSVGRGCPRIPAILDIGHCGVPYQLANFQGLHECSGDMAMVRPQTVADVQAAVAKYSKVKAVGTGLSWNTEQFCSGTGPKAAGIAMTELARLTPLFTQRPDEWDTAGPDFPIQVDYGAMTVTVDAGVPLRTMLDLLSGLRDPAHCPIGCFLTTIPQLIDQTAAGAVSTGTHGSSAYLASVSDQIVALEVVTADGVLRNITHEANPHLFRALRVAVGRLGIITKVTFKIVPQPTIKRKRLELTPQQAVAKMLALQEAYKAALKSGSEDQISKVLQQVKGFLVLWFQPLDQVWWITFEETQDKPTADDLRQIRFLTDLSEVLNAGHVKGMKDFQPAPGTQQLPDNPIFPDYLLAADAKIIQKLIQGYVGSGLDNLTAPANFGVATSRPEYVNLWGIIAPSNEYEVCVPFERAGDAMQQLLKENNQLEGGMRTPSGFRFVQEEESYLGYGAGGPRVCIELDDFVGPSFGKDQPQVQRMAEILMSYSGRLHWGKYGWPKFEPCFDGAASHGVNWCHFGCAANTLDPARKFEPVSNVWSWSATKRGKPVSFASCCTPEGFSAECTCAPRDCKNARHSEL
ncbi:hypothetical protein WJX72_007930 [[Myrmecia] bisecta]|uniref:FAD-binding PCMH-type domain-containing protein n=1 Tax=[Myrmecia] bisecta TaxID=41462 RepID=A0AAW1PI61_9CHLO